MSKQELKAQLKQEIAEKIKLKEQVIKLKEQYLQSITQQVATASKCHYCIYRHPN